MISLHAISSKLGSKLAENSGAKEKQAVAAYGLELFLGAALKLAVLIVLGVLFGVLAEILTAAATFGMFRMLSGGVHCTAYYRCLLVGSLIFLSCAVASNVLPGIFPEKYFELTAAGISGAAVLVYAPSISEKRKAVGDINRWRFKILSLVFVAIWTILAAAADVSASIKYASATGLVFQAVTFHPLGMKMINKLDMLLASSTQKFAGGGET